MEDRKFDDLTRFIGRRASRRAVVKGAAAAALAAVFGRAAGGDADVAEAAVPQQGGVKQRVKGFCNAAGQLCKNSINPTKRCCYRCAGTGKNAKCCEAEGYACTQDSHCCDGRICRDPNLFDGVNLKGCFNSGSLNYGGQCTSSSDCNGLDCVGAGICCTPEQICEGGSTCCAPDEGCVEDSCCPVENICDVNPYDGTAAQCCDPYSEVCTADGCCAYENLCGDECCDPYTEYCDGYLGYCVSNT
ncbi:MAG: hypothetical protein DCC58_07040 [Chloroflexi bacterium]|nr:MAG: hypothetical protein DCC58_07040 [Chloroflexota bacterium]